jgi:AcrR family transcriptional regulator
VTSRAHPGPTTKRRRPGLGRERSVGGVARTADGERRAEILATASQLFASSGLRTSLLEIADACGIQPGSLYHHFESKEAIVVELVQRYHADLDSIAAAALEQPSDAEPGLVLERLVRLGTDIAHCAVRHAAAVHFTFYEPPVGSSHELVRLTSRAPTAVQAAMLETLRVGRSSGAIRTGSDLTLLAERICHAMLHVGLGLFHRYPAVDRVAQRLCEIVLYGVATVPPRDAALDRSKAFRAVERVMATWREGDGTQEEDRAALIQTVARSEFGRRGYEVTTIRDIATVAGSSIGTVYRAIGSKEELLASIMQSFSGKVTAGWSAALGSDASAVEKLDAVAWLQINSLSRFNDEFKIQLAWLRQSPPDTRIEWSIPAVLRLLKSLLAEGDRAGDVRLESPSAELTARCIIELTWIPERIVRSAGRRAALGLARDTLIRGIARRSPLPGP